MLYVCRYYPVAMLAPAERWYKRRCWFGRTPDMTVKCPVPTVGERAAMVTYKDNLSPHLRLAGPRIR